MRLLRAVIPLIMLLTASPIVIAQSYDDCEFDFCFLNGECLATCVAVYSNIFLEDASKLTTTTNTDTYNTNTNTNTNTNSVSNRIASLLERLERVEIATRQHAAQSASSTSHQDPNTGIIDTDEENPDGSGIPFRRAQVGLRPSTDDNELIEQHITIPELIERVARIERATNHHATRQHQHQQHAAIAQDDDDDEEEPQTGIIGTDEEIQGDEGPGHQFFRGQFGPHSFSENSEQYPAFMERHHSNSNSHSHSTRDHQQLHHHATEHHNANINTQTTTDDQGFPIHYGGVANEDGSWFSYATGAADVPSDEDDYADYFGLLERRARAAHAQHSTASEPQTGIFGTDEEIPGEEGPGHQFARGQFGPHTINDDDEEEEHGFTAMMERIQRLEHTMNMAEQRQQQQQQQHSSSNLLEADATTHHRARHHSRSGLRRLRAAIDATRT